MLAGLALFYGLLSFGRYWIGPVNTQAEIDLLPRRCPSTRCSRSCASPSPMSQSGFTLVYGYVAAYNREGRALHDPAAGHVAVDSGPQLSARRDDLHGGAFSHPAIGRRTRVVLLIFTGQVWNMTFSFYSSLKSIPREMHEAAQVYRLSWWQRFVQMELPYAAIGLIWNSMMSVAGGWFFLMACEMFVLGNRDLRLPGLGSYLQTAANAGDTRAIVWGLGGDDRRDRADRPVDLAAGDRLGREIQIRASGSRGSAALTRSGLAAPLADCCRWSPRVRDAAARKLDLHFARAHAASPTPAKRLASKWIARFVGAVRWPVLPTRSSGC